MKKDFCPECGPAEVNHFITKWSQLLEIISLKFTKPLTPIVRFFTTKFYVQIDFITYWFLKFLGFLRLVKLMKEPSSELDTDRTKGIWESGKKMGAKISEVWVWGRPINIFLAKLPNGKEMIFEGLPRPGAPKEALEWMDDKSEVKKRLGKAGFPVPKGGAFFLFSSAKRFFNKFGKTVIAKPVFGSRSRHTRIHIKDENFLKESFFVAKQICPFVSIEEELQGLVHRVVLIGGKCVAVLRRDPPYVIGDGKHTIKELINKANDDHRRKGVFHEIPVNFELDMELKNQGFSLEFVPGPNVWVSVGTKIGRSQGGVNTDVTEMLNLKNKMMFEKMAKFIDDPLMGVDFIIKDISKPYDEQMPCGVIELNSIPFLDLHMYPFEGKKRDLFTLLWQEVLK
jgi:D-alanine-D-alanine ligase-like ATP-grasp enzyme